MTLQPLLRFQGLDTKDVQCLLQVLPKELPTDATDGSGIGGTDGRGIGGTGVCGNGQTDAGGIGGDSGVGVWCKRRRLVHRRGL